MDTGKPLRWLPAGAGVLAAVVLVFWFTRPGHLPLTPRLPGTDHAPGSGSAGAANPVLNGKVVPGPGQAGDLPGFWPGFRGQNRTGAAETVAPLARSWEASGPRELWAVELGEGYAGPAVAEGRVYLLDYEREKKADTVRCLSLSDGKEIWRYTYPVSVKRNHGMSRTVPALSSKYVISLGPKCHVACLDKVTGQLKWGLDLVQQFGATVPPWYAGQCPLIDGQTVILAPGGKDALLIGVDLESGRVLWQTPNPNGWKMTHSSVMPMDFSGERSYIYCASQGVVGVSAKDGRLLWDTPDWKISIATVPSPVVLEDARIFLSGGYDAGSRMLQVRQTESKWEVTTLFKLDADTFGATQQTPILHKGHLYGVRPDGQFVCLTPDGKIVWTSGPGQGFGLGPFLLADGLIFAMNDSGTLTLLEANEKEFRRLAQAKVLHGRESWGPMALAGTRLLARDLTRMVCLEVGAPR